ncbi:MAG: YqgE/AlgH family protein [Methylotenera sp.]
MALLENMNLTGQFLIAMPAMTDPYFSKTVTYICTHNQDGAMGVIINRSADISVADLFEQIQLEAQSQAILKKTVHFGGPVQTERGFILHDIMPAPHHEFNSTIVVNNAVALTTSKDILEATAQNKGPQKMLIALGYAGWTAGQLENELAQNAWLSLETNNLEDIHALIFDMADHEKFDCAMRMMGLNLANLSDVAGHA